MNKLITFLMFFPLASGQLYATSAPPEKASQKPKLEALTPDKESKRQSRYTRIIFLGDSLTEGFGVRPEASFPSLVADKLKDEGFAAIDIINAGISGATTAGAVRRLNWHLRGANEKTLLVVALGANDGLRGLELSASRKNLDDTISRAKKGGMEVVLAGMKIPPNYGESYAQEFESLYPVLAKKHEITLIPFLLDGVAANPELNLPDGIHPNEKGYEIIATNVLEHLKPLLEKP